MEGDYISRQALKDNINSWYDLVNSFGQTNITLSHDDIIKKIDMQTAVELKSKPGHWEETRYRSVDQTGETYDDGVGFRCSICANVFKVTSLNRYNYCPNCGADMRGEENDK